MRVDHTGLAHWRRELNRATSSSRMYRLPQSTSLSPVLLQSSPLEFVDDSSYATKNQRKAPLLGEFLALSWFLVAYCWQTHPSGQTWTLSGETGLLLLKRITSTIMIAQHQHQTVLQSPEGPASLGSVQLDQLAVGKVTFLKMFWR